MDRELRNLIHQKGSRVKVTQSHPLASDGKDGDIILYGLGTNSILYVKGFDKWWSFKSADIKGHGWHGSTSKVKILPTHFISTQLTTPVSRMDSSYYGYIQLKREDGSDFADGQVNADVVVPKGYKLRGYQITTIADSDDSSILVSIYENFVSKSGNGSSFGTGTVNEYIPSASKGSDDNFFTIRLENLHETTKISGGYLDISPTLTPELIAEGATSEDGLFRG